MQTLSLSFIARHTTIAMRMGSLIRTLKIKPRSSSPSSATARRARFILRIFRSAPALRILLMGRMVGSTSSNAVILSVAKDLLFVLVGSIAMLRQSCQREEQAGPSTARLWRSAQDDKHGGLRFQE